MTPIAVMLSDKFYLKEKDLKGKKVLLRVDFNVSIKDNNVSSNFRINRTIPTLRSLVESGAKIIIISHIDDKEGGTLEPVARRLVAEFPRLFFVKDIFSDTAKTEVSKMNNGDIVLFENLRKWEGEKNNDVEFSKYLASFADLYINEAFSVSHRAHASIVGVTGFLPSFFGNAFKEEIANLSQVFNPHKPFLAVLGGAKFETKLPLVTKFLNIADLVLVGGAIANDLLKAKGYFVGDSLVSDQKPEGINEIVNHNKLLLPLDVYTQYKGDKILKNLSEIGVGEKILDIGEKTLKMLKIAVTESEFILWNGPLGKVESGFGGSSEEFAKVLASSGKISIVGGGDCVSVIEDLGLMDKFTFISSGGGAMLDFLADETLVGIEALITSKKKQNFAFSLDSKAETIKKLPKSIFAKIRDLF